MDIDISFMDEFFDNEMKKISNEEKKYLFALANKEDSFDTLRYPLIGKIPLTVRPEELPKTTPIGFTILRKYRYQFGNGRVVSAYGSKNLVV